MNYNSMIKFVLNMQNFMNLMAMTTASETNK